MGGSIDATGNGDLYNCQLNVNGTRVPGTFRTSLVSFAGGDHSANSRENCSTDGGQAVGAGTYMVALNVNDTDTVILGEASVWVIWVPFDGEGNVPAP